jgi:trigger factor
MNGFREAQADDAKRRVKMRLIIKAVAKEQGFEVSDEEVAEELVKMASMYGMEPDKLRDALGEERTDMIRDDVRNRKAVNYIYESAVVEG